MTATTAPAPAGQTVFALGFELHFTGVGRHGEDSDKFWRSVVSGSTVVTHYGRRNTAGQYTVKHFASDAQAREYAISKTAEKERKTGYWISRNAVRFEVPAELVATAGSTKWNHEQGSVTAAARLVRAFLDTSDRTA